MASNPDRQNDELRVPLHPNSLSRCWQSAHKLPWIDFEPLRDLDDRLQAQTPLTALDLAKLSPVDATPNSSSFLAQPEFKTAVPDAFAEDARRFIEGRLDWVGGHDVQPHTARAQTARVCHTHVYCTHAY